MNPSQTRVCAVVVTFNRKALLAECLRALQEQTRPVDHILVVDNASTDGTTEAVRAEFPWVEVLRLPRNGGGAGGFHAGMKHAFENSFDWLWLMDDDGTPAPNCLQLLIEAADESKAAVALSVQQDKRGRLYGFGGSGTDAAGSVVEHGRPQVGPFRFTFVGPLISRDVIERVGLPIKEFFIWLDDFEFATRVNEAGFPIVAVPDARFFHDPGGTYREYSFLGRKSVRPLQPAWKVYYGARNGLYLTIHVHREDWHAVRRYVLNEMRLLLGDLMYEPKRWQRARYRLRGLRDGARGRLGKRT